MKENATLEDYQDREKFLIKYLQSQIFKTDEILRKYYSLENYGKNKAYKDLLYKLTEFNKNDFSIPDWWIMAEIVE